MSNPYFRRDARCFIIAEIGANHNGDIDLCLETMMVAAECGADAIKLQYYSASELVADVDRVWAWGPEGNQTEERVGEMFDRLGLSFEEMERVYAYGRELGVPVFCTPFSVEGVAALEKLRNPIYKIASSDVSYYPMLKAIAATNKPVILSTGKSPMEDVLDALSALGDVPDEDLAILHCIAMYPAPFEEMNINVVATFRERFPNNPVGLSDHCRTHEPALASVVLGGTIIEKHFTLSHDLDGPDHWFSMDPAELEELVRQVRRIEAALGDGQKGIATCEELEAHYSRRSIIVMRDVAAGAPITADDLAMLRPGTGIHPRHFHDVLGRTAKRDISAREPLVWEMLE